MLNLLGIIFPYSTDPPAWYITYVLATYLLFYLMSTLYISNTVKIIALYISFFVIYLLINDTPSLSSHIGIWCKYTIVFPTSVLLGIHYKAIYHHIMLHNNKQTYYLPIAIAILMYVFIMRRGMYCFCNILNLGSFGSDALSMLYDLLFICSILLLTLLFDHYSIYSSLLSFIGKYSSQIFLIHYPFMVHYDFFLFRKPLSLMLLIYFAFVILASMGLKKISGGLTEAMQNAFSRYGIPARSRSHSGQS